MMKRFSSFALLIWSVIAFGFTLGCAYADKRVALVIGNATYSKVTKLSNPENDSGDIASALRGLGFDVIQRNDLDKRGMDLALQDFSRKAAGADAALFFFAGHALQFHGRNYLLPVDAELEDEVSLRYQTVPIEDIRAALDRAKDGVKILILDACRNNPLAEPLTRSAGLTRDVGTTRGLARLDRTEGMVVAYATQADQVAQDGSGRNSPFSEALIRRLREPGLEIATLFRRVAADVNDKTGGRQRPELSISLLSDYYLNMTETDSTAWGRIRSSDSPEDFKGFIAKYPSSPFARDAQVRLDLFDRILRENQQNQERESLRAQAEKDALARIEQEKKALEKLETDRLSALKAEIERLEKERKAQADRFAQEKAEAEKRAADRLAQEKADAAKREADRIAQEQAGRKVEEARLAQEKKLEADRVAAEQKLEAERVAAEKKAEADRIAAEKKAEKERIAQEKLDAEKRKAEEIAAAKAEATRVAAEKKAEAERLAQEKKAEKERLAAEKKIEAARLAQEKKDAAKAEADRLAAAKAAAEKLAAEQKAAAEKLAAEQKAAAEKLAAEQKATAEKLAAQRKAEAEKLAAAKAEADRKETERRAEEKRKADEQLRIAALAVEEAKRKEQEAAAKRLADTCTREGTELNGLTAAGNKDALEAFRKRSACPPLATTVASAIADINARAAAACEQDRASLKKIDRKDAAGLRAFIGSAACADVGESAREQLAKLEADNARQEEACVSEEAQLKKLSEEKGAKSRLSKLEREMSCDRLKPLVTATLKEIEANEPKSNTAAQIRQAQIEMTRIGCFRGVATGTLNQKTKSAISLTLTKLGAPSKETSVDDDFIGKLKEQKEGFCPPPAPTPNVASASDDDDDEDLRPARRRVAPAPVHRPVVARPAPPAGPVAQQAAPAVKRPPMLGVGF